MVWPFSRKKVIDLTDKNLVFMNSQKPVSRRSLSAEEYADLTKPSSSVSSTSPSTSTNDNSFGNFFSAASESTSSFSSSSGSSNLELQGLKNKFEDLEYKMENIMRKLNGLLDRFEVVEKKVDRGLI